MDGIASITANRFIFLTRMKIFKLKVIFTLTYDTEQFKKSKYFSSKNKKAKK